MVLSELIVINSEKRRLSAISKINKSRNKRIHTKANHMEIIKIYCLGNLMSSLCEKAIKKLLYFIEISQGRSKWSNLIIIIEKRLK